MTARWVRWPLLPPQSFTKTPVLTAAINKEKNPCNAGQWTPAIAPYIVALKKINK